MHAWYACMRAALGGTADGLCMADILFVRSRAIACAGGRLLAQPCAGVLSVGHGALRSQGGTCVLVGDDAKRMAEAEKLARREIGCKVLRTSAYFQPEGHVQVGLRAGFLAASPEPSAGCPGADAWYTLVHRVHCVAQQGARMVVNLRMHCVAWPREHAGGLPGGSSSSPSNHHSVCSLPDTCAISKPLHTAPHCMLRAVEW